LKVFNKKITNFSVKIERLSEKIKKFVLEEVTLKNVWKKYGRSME
jgi:hypothetical protein